MSASTTFSSSRPARDWPLGLWWVLASVAGWVLGAALMFGLMNLVYALWPATNVDVDDIVVPIAMVLCVPLFQWLLLRRRIPRAGTWYLAMAAGVTAFYLLARTVDPVLRNLSLSEAEERLLDLAKPGALGLCLGAAQWPVLRRHIRLPGLWIVASVLGWASVRVVSGRLEEAGTLLPFLIAAGVITGIWTGVALALLWKRPEKPAAATVGG